MVSVALPQKKQLYRQAFNVQSISKSFNGLDQIVLNKISLIVEAGEKIAVVGPNGSGKSTLLSCILGSNLEGLDPDSGECKWAENSVISFLMCT